MRATCRWETVDVQVGDDRRVRCGVGGEAPIDTVGAVAFDIRFQFWDLDFGNSKFADKQNNDETPEQVTANE